MLNLNGTVLIQYNHKLGLLEWPHGFSYYLAVFEKSTNFCRHLVKEPKLHQNLKLKKLYIRKSFLKCSIGIKRTF